MLRYMPRRTPILSVIGSSRQRISDMMDVGKQPVRRSSISPQMHVNKKLSLADEPITIKLSGLQAYQRTTLHASTTLTSGAKFESFSQYIADSLGDVFLERDGSHGGRYQGIEPMGLFWSMQPSPANKRQHERFIVKEPSNPFTVDFNLYDNFIDTFEEISAVPGSNILAKTSISRTFMAPGVREFDVRDGRVRATLFLPPGDGPFPGVISMSGGYPGAMKHKAALLASRGFAALALKFFGVDDLPPLNDDLDLEYFEEAAVFLKNHPNVNGTKGIGLIANCFGGHIALAVANCAPAGLINSVVAISAWTHVLADFKLKYKGGVTKRPANITTAVSDGPKGSKYVYSEIKEDSNLRAVSYDFQREIPYLLIYGGKDGSFDTKIIKNHAKLLLKAVSHKNYQILFYPNAGHLIENAYSPHTEVAWTINVHQYTGGELPYHAKAEEDSWPKILAFLHRNLSSGMSKL